MCWACYTPLTGGAPVAAAAGAAAVRAGAAPADVGEEKERKIQPWQIGVVVVGLLIVLVMGVRSMMPPSDSSIDEAAIPTTPVDPGGSSPAPAPPQGSTGPTAPLNQGGSGGGSVADPEAPFTIAAAPNPE